MKKLLYGTTALVAAGLLSSGAYAADPIKLSVGGYFNAAFAYSDQDDGTAGGVNQPAANTRSHAIVREAEIHFVGQTTLDNGIKVGVNVQLEAQSSADIIDESYIWFEGSWGRIQIGAEDDAAYLLNVGATKATNFFYGVASPVYSLVECGTNTLSLFSAPTMASGFAASGAALAVGTPGVGCYIGAYSPALTSDREKITYFTPKFGGFQFGISYTPNNHEEPNVVGGDVANAGTYSARRPDNITGQQGEVISIGAAWSGKLGELDVRVSAGYQSADLEANNNVNAIASLDRAGGTGLNVFEDRDTWIVAGAFTWKQFTLGATYYHDDYGLRLNGDRRDWTVGLTYKTGPWQFGIEYANTEQERGGAATTGDDKGEAFAVGVSYSLGAGVSLQAELQFWDIDSGAATQALRTAAQNDATVFIIGTTIFF
jgi:predicted porin